MEKICCFIGLIVFLVVTVLVLATDIGSFEHTLSFSSQKLALNAADNAKLNTGETKLKDSNANIEHLDIKLNGQKLVAKDADLSVNFKELENSSVKYYNYPSKYGTGSVKYYPSSNKVKPSEIKKLKSGLSPRNKTLVPMKYESDKSTNNQYKYKNIDWGTWRSDFINRITDDSMSIRELDNYPQGTMFHYSFVVDASGRISNVKVDSLQLSKADKAKVAYLINSYAYTEITSFPVNSKRQSAKVSAILLLSNKTEYARPSDFHDLEQVKIKF